MTISDGYSKQAAVARPSPEVSDCVNDSRKRWIAFSFGPKTGPVARGEARERRGAAVRERAGRERDPCLEREAARDEREGEEWRLLRVLLAVVWRAMATTSPACP
jgi:hypothetical protein